MPRFFFHLHDGASAPDSEGTELVDWVQAQREAIRTAGTILATNPGQLRLGEDWCLEVVNEAGLAVLRLEVGLSAGSLEAMSGDRGGTSWGGAGARDA